MERSNQSHAYFGGNKQGKGGLSAENGPHVYMQKRFNIYQGIHPDFKFWQYFL
jgi:hypothetical protein